MTDSADGPRGVAVITGGSRGIGAATARLAAAAGYDICLSYATRADAAEDVAAACRAAGVRATAVRAEPDRESDIDRLFGAADGLGPVTALVNNAGIVDTVARVEDMAADRLTRMFAVNVVGPFGCAAAAVRRMSTRRGGPGGAIVNVSSRSSVTGSPGRYVDYAASKAAIDTLTVGLAKEVAAEGIRVNAVRPGIVETEIHRVADGTGELTDRLHPVPMGRAGQPQEIAHAIVWLLSPQASYLTGSIVDVGGGL